MRLTALLMMVLALGGIARAGGADIFNSNCIVCHQADGNGVPGMYPPLADSVGNYIATRQGRAYLVHVVSFGMTGAISVHGQYYDGVMQPWPKFGDDELAQVLNYVLTNFNAKLLPKDFLPFTADEVRKYRAANATLGDTYKEREAMLKALAAHQAHGS